MAECAHASVQSCINRQSVGRNTWRNSFAPFLRPALPRSSDEDSPTRGRNML